LYFEWNKSIHRSNKLSLLNHGVPMQPPNDDAQLWKQTWTALLRHASPDCDAVTWTNDIDRRKMKLLAPYLPKEGRALEVGCGSARLLCRVGRMAPLTLAALDSEPTALKLAADTANAFGVKVDTVLGDVRALPFENGSFDLILSGGLLEHFEDPKPVLIEMLRVIRPGGTFYADVVPRKKSWYRLGEARRMRESPWLAPGVYESSFGPNDYVPWLDELGLEEVQITSCGVYPSIIGHMPWWLRRMTARCLEPLDGCRAGDSWGWYFVILGRKKRG
jgi:SAM-dependent methyltransferase